MLDTTSKIRDTEATWITDPNLPVKIRMGKDGISARNPLSIPAILTKTATEFPKHSALVHQDINKKWQHITFE